MPCQSFGYTKVHVWKDQWLISLFCMLSRFMATPEAQEEQLCCGNGGVQGFCRWSHFSDSEKLVPVLSLHYPRSKWDIFSKLVTTNIPLCRVQDIMGPMKSITVVNRYITSSNCIARLRSRVWFMVVVIQGQSLLGKCLLTSPLSSLQFWGFVIIHLFIHLTVFLMLMSHNAEITVEPFCVLRCYCVCR